MNPDEEHTRLVEKYSHIVGVTTILLQNEIERITYEGGNAKARHVGNDQIQVKTHEVTEYEKNSLAIP